MISLVSGLDNPDLPRHMEHYNSSCGDSVIFTMVPSDPATTFSNRSFATGTIRRRHPRHLNARVGVLLLLK